MAGRFVEGLRSFDRRQVRRQLAAASGRHSLQSLGSHPDSKIRFFLFCEFLSMECNMSNILFG